MGLSARLYFTLLHLANLHFSFQCINVNSSKLNNISVINVSVIKMYKYVSNDNVHISVSDKECSNIDLKVRKKRITRREKGKKCHSLFFLCNPQEQTLILLSFCKSFVFKMYTF